MSTTATITSKGQLTLPRAARKVLASNTVEVEVQGETVILRPVRSVAGALAKYAAGKKAMSIGEMREQVWGEVARGRKP
jgi:bifunctional DNA-binding transcriptional regulator/antitoxin component of YhaV-PrlF toxin-antitoxin module